MSVTSKSSTNISQSEIDELAKYLNNLLCEIDVKTAQLQSATPQKICDNNYTPQNNDDDYGSVASTTIAYKCSQDDENADITNIAAYVEIEEMKAKDPVELNNPNNGQQPNIGDNWYSTDFDSIDEDITLFSPVTPKYPKFCETEQYADSVKSLNTISSVETVNRPQLNKGLEDQAFEKVDHSPFHLFDMSELDATTHGYKKIGSRLVAYYGVYPYNYSSTEHPPRSFEENCYLMHVLSYVRIVLPGIQFNSAMIHKYEDGESFMPHHSDNEDCIENGSVIVGISLGDTRLMEFKNKNTGVTTNVQLMHGDVVTMSKASQSFFTHSIRTDPETSTRISITLRQIKPMSDHHDPHNTTPKLCGNSARPDELTNGACDGYQAHDAEIHVDGFQPFPTLPPLPPPPFRYDYPNVPLIRTEPSPQVHNFQRNNMDNLTQNGQNSHQPQRRGWEPPSSQKPPNWNNPRWQPHKQQTSEWLPSSFRPHQPQLPQRSMPSRFVPEPKKTKPSHSLNPLKFTPSMLHPSRQQSVNVNAVKSKEEIVFISSSMFSDLDPEKLSTEEINAHVFFYRGADSYKMIERMRRDVELQKLPSQYSISKVFLMTGTNNVYPVCNNVQSMRDACSSLAQTIDYVKLLFPTAVLSLINILPRASNNRMRVIDGLNNHINSLVAKDNTGRLKFIDTYLLRLFTFNDGKRKDYLFKCNHKNDNDNVHLCSKGIAKLGKHLKYLAHI